MGRGQRGNNVLVQLSANFQSLLLLPTSKLGPSGADSRVGGFEYIPGPCGSLQRTLLGGCEFLLLPQPPQVFSVRGFEALFPHAGTLGCTVCLAPQLFLPGYLHMNVGPPTPPAATLPASYCLAHPAPQPAALPQVLSAQLPVSASPTGLDKCFFFNSLVVRLLYSSIFWQFLLFFCF